MDERKNEKDHLDSRKTLYNGGKKTVAFTCSHSIAERVDKDVRILICEILNLAAFSMNDGKPDPAFDIAMKGRKPRRSKFEPKPEKGDKAISLRIRAETLNTLLEFTNSRTGFKMSDILRGAALFALEES